MFLNLVAQTTKSIFVVRLVDIFFNMR